MKFLVKTTKSVDKNIQKLPENIKKKLAVLLEDLRDFGPVQKN